MLVNAWNIFGDMQKKQQLLLLWKKTGRLGHPSITKSTSISFVTNKGLSEKERWWWKQKSEWCHCWKETTDSILWKGKRINSPPEPLQRSLNPGNTLIFSTDSLLDFWPPEQKITYLSCFLSHYGCGTLLQQSKPRQWLKLKSICPKSWSTPVPGEDDTDSFFLAPPLWKQLKVTERIQKTIILLKTFKDGKKKADWLGTHDLRNNSKENFWVSFYLP